MPTEKTTVTNYTNFAKGWAERLAKENNIGQDTLEKPAMYSKLPELKGKKVLCLGCGTGEECDHLKSLGADVLGVDISPGLIEYAKEHHPEIEFLVQDMEHLNLQKDSFDYVYSSLVLHYVDDWHQTLKNISECLKPGGLFLFSTHHPVKWGAERTRGDFSTMYLGADWSKDTCKVRGEYLNLKKIDDMLLGEFPVTYYNRPISAMLKDIRESGFEVIDMLEPKATELAKEKNLNFYTIHQTIPLFILFELKKK